MKQDTHSNETVGIGNQADDLEQHLPLETFREVLREFLNTASLVAHRFPGKPQDL